MSDAELGLNADQARRITDQIKVAVEGAWLLIREAYETRAWAALGYTSWDDYCTREFGSSRLRLPREERSEIVGSLRDAGLSTRAIGAALGVGKGTVARSLPTVPDGTVGGPSSIVGVNGKHYNASRPAGRRPEPGEQFADSSGDTRTIVAVEPGLDGELVLHDGNGDAVIIADPEEDPEEAYDADDLPEPPTRPPIVKPDLGGGVSHPARYSDILLPVFADLLAGYIDVLDPFAGTGKIHDLTGEHVTIGVEIEPEWAALHPSTHCGNALDLQFDDNQFDAICTSPTYGNRLADSYNSADPHLRRSYRFDLGRELHDDNSGAMQWGDTYRQFHLAAWQEAIRVLRPGGRFVLNIKDHLRNGQWQDVTGWHIGCLQHLGLAVAACRPVVTRHLRQGENSDSRAEAELVVALNKPSDV